MLILSVATNLCYSVEGKVAKGEDVQGWSIVVSGTHGLWRHVHMCPWQLCERPSHLTRPCVDNAGVSHVRDLGHQRGGEEDISGSQVPVNDWRCPLVEVDQSTGHILQDRAF